MADRHIIFKDKVCKNENIKIIDSMEDIKTVIMGNIFNYIQGGRLRGIWMPCRDNQYEDIDEMDLKDRKQIFHELLKEHLIHTTSGEEEISITNNFCDILQQCRHALERFMKTMARAVEITFFDEYIEVHNAVNITYITSENVNAGFTYNPWLYEGLESETFKIEELKNFVLKEEKQNMLDHKKDKLTFNVADLMVLGNGYVITLNSAEPGIIKMKKDDL